MKHVGRLKTNGRKVLVAYRTLPGESDSALIIDTALMAPEDHDAIISCVEGNAGQSAYEFAEVLARTKFSDGSVMLARLHKKGMLTKVKTSDVEMIPATNAVVGLDQLNQIIAEQRGISVNDLALGNNVEVQEVATAKDLSPQETLKEDAPLSDDDLARQYRSQADAMYKEAKRLREEAEKLSPTKRKTKKKEEAEA
jgi:hypothetical protein